MYSVESLVVTRMFCTCNTENAMGAGELATLESDDAALLVSEDACVADTPLPAVPCTNKEGSGVDKMLCDEPPSKAYVCPVVSVC